MSYSHIVNGKVLDVTSKKCKYLQGRYVVYLGEIYIGQIYKMKLGHWDILTAWSSPFNGLSGFVNKYKCYDVLLKAFEQNKESK